MRQKEMKMKKELKGVDTVKLLEEGITISDVRELNWDTHNVFPPPH